MTADEAKGEIYKAFDTAYANYIIEALTNGATCSDNREPLNNAPWGVLKPVDFCATCERVVTLQAKIYVYEKIIANSNFAPMVQAMNTQAGVCMNETTPAEERKSKWVVRKSMIEGEDYEVQCEKCGHKVAIIAGADSYEEALERFQLWLKHDVEGIFTKYCSLCGARMEGDI